MTMRNKIAINILLQVSGLLISGLVGPILALLTGIEFLFYFFWWFGICIRLVLDILGKLYEKGHWFSRKECLIDFIFLLILGFIGFIEIYKHINS